MVTSGAGDGRDLTYHGIITHLLGVSAESDRSALLEHGISYVFLAISQQQGPLRHQLLTSAECIASPLGPSRPLSLMPRSSQLWVTNAINECNAGSGSAAWVCEAR